ncbi:MAG: Formyltetrahydrofolate deformylase (EC [uncultured Campylobacterales bacterium]|uniref:Formyltetrahydrofolate deformylase n=1 Tax=uncultured Campylobacterales bacterium TaxID=352960 RepID=A0A6S6T753_9BACT|nr:MAG: Formyltetrahydrofolate deformylase (EC [uncultured Campylobacterales bacterium]
MKYIIKITCNDEKGLVYKISKVIFDNKLNIIENAEFVDHTNQKFFFRAVVEGDTSKEILEKELKNSLTNADINIKTKAKKKILILCTKESHVVGDLLVKNFSDELGADIVGVISNHNNLRELVSGFDIPYEYISHKDISRQEHEKEIIKAIKTYSFDYIVLAKYMRILTPEFIKNFDNEEIINIHHSFLPAFVGANPYKQAYQRGVKIVGATAHFVNEVLDEGPIISQDITAISHSNLWQDIQKVGRLIETKVLNQGLSLVLNDKVFINGNKTIIL